MKDLYQSDFQLPNQIYIVGPGPQGKAFYNTIPPEAFVIALNKAVLIPDLSIDAWLINHTHQLWFPEADATYTGTRIYRREAALQVLPNLSGPEHWYYYHASQNIDIKKFHRMEQQLQFGGTVASSALQIAYYFGAREVLLCGIDMAGYRYWDGSTDPEVTHYKRFVKSWAALRVINPLIQYLKEEKGMQITSISPTHLKVPRYEFP